MTSTIDPKTRAAAFINAAVSLQQVGEYERGLELLKEACQIAPNYTPVHVSLGLAYQAKSKHQEAESAYRKAIELEPENPQALKALGLFLISQNRPAESLVWLEKYILLNPADGEILDAITNAFVSTNRPDEAIKMFENAWNASQDPDIGLRYTRFLFAHNKPDDARRIIEQVRKVKETPQILAEMALSEVIEGKYAEAVQSLLCAVKLDESYDRAWRGLAQCYAHMDQPERALDSAERALAINPKHYRNWEAKVDALIVSGQYEEALKAVQSGMELISADDQEAQPVLAVLYFQRFHALIQLGHLEEGLETLNRARKLFPKDERFYSLAVKIYQQTGRPQDGLKVLDQANSAGLSAGGRFIPMRYMLLHQMGKPDEAWEVVKDQFKTRKQNRIETLVISGVQLYSTGHYQPARKIFEQLISVVPDDIRLRTNLGFVLIGEGALDQAESHFNNVISHPADDGFELIARCNLGFVRVLQNRLSEAQSEFEKVLQEADADQEAILRVVFCWKGQIVSDYAPHPNRSIKLRIAAQANLVAIALVQGDLPEAQKFFDTLKTSCSEPLLSELMACMKIASAKPAAAKKALRLALEAVQNQAEKQMVETWLAGLIK
jgi:tetratricopeptide (TPR) repeat protein